MTLKNITQEKGHTGYPPTIPNFGPNLPIDGADSNAGGTLYGQELWAPDMLKKAKFRLLLTLLASST